MKSSEVFRRPFDKVPEKDIDTIENIATKKLVEIGEVDEKYEITKSLGLRQERHDRDIIVFRHFFSQFSLSRDIAFLEPFARKSEKDINLVFPFNITAKKRINGFNNLISAYGFLNQSTEQYIQDNYKEDIQRAYAIKDAVKEYFAGNNFSDPWTTQNEEEYKKRIHWSQKWGNILVPNVRSENNQTIMMNNKEYRISTNKVRGMK